MSSLFITRLGCSTVSYCLLQPSYMHKYTQSSIPTGIWKVVSPALDPQVRSKVQLTKSAEVSSLLWCRVWCHLQNLSGFRLQELHIHIDPSHLAPGVGGRNTWAWQYPSIVHGENIRMEDVNTRDVCPPNSD
jgi:hypothetical protein